MNEGTLNSKIAKLNSLREQAVDPFLKVSRLNDGEVEATFKDERVTPGTDEMFSFMLNAWQRMELSESIIKELVERLHKAQ